MAYTSESSGTFSIVRHVNFYVDLHSLSCLLIPGRDLAINCEMFTPGSRVVLSRVYSIERQH